MTKKSNYWHIDAGFFPVTVKLCFDNNTFQEILRDHKVDIKATALDYGVGETHYMSDGKEAIIVMVFDLDECDIGPAYLSGAVAHEATHCVSRIFDHIGENPDEIGEETRAYLTEHVVRQITQAIILEKENRERERNRAAAGKKSKAGGRADIQVDKHSHRSAGSDSDTKQKPKVRGAKDKDRRPVGAAKARVC